MNHPYQCIQPCGDVTRGAKFHILAACGPNIFVIDSEAGIVSSWPERLHPDCSSPSKREETSDEPPEKRRKVSELPVHQANITLLKATNDRQHFVAVTGEDKSIRVFNVDVDHRVRELSARCLQKRPCAIALTSDNKTILCGDKFGDVYALPLLPTHEELNIPTPISVGSEVASGVPAPAANHLTVHSGRNRKALETQQKSVRHPKTKLPPTFKHEMLLGHVSMLTDVVFLSRPTTHPDEIRPRSYIFSADRDEHIRISRGPPQTHVIEGFCLGHKDFISKLCLLSDDILVSGGGDDDLLIWDWSPNKLLRKLDLRSSVLACLRNLPEWDEEALLSRRIAVSGLWKFPSQGPGPGTEKQSQTATLLVAVEGVPAVFAYDCSTLQDLQGLDAARESRYQQEDIPCRAIPLPGNVLDIAVGSDIIVVSVDNIHKPGSVDQVRTDMAACPRLAVLHMTTSETASAGWEATDLQSANSQMIDPIRPDKVKEGTSLSDLLYGIESLRKRRGADAVSEG